jgi:HK97 family phage portal protein
MGFLSNFVSTHGRGDFLERWLFGMGGGKATSGVRVNHETAMNYSAVWAATRLLTGTMSTLPRELYRQTGRSKDPARDNPTRRMFKRQPNPMQGSVTFLETEFNHLINWGNSYAEKGFDEFGRVDTLWPIHPERVTYDEREEIYYVRNDQELSVTPFTSKEIFHVPGLFGGKGVIHHAAESIGMGLATEQYGASFFGNGAGPSFALTHPKTLGPEAAENLRQSWRKRYSGPTKANGLLVLEEGTVVTPITVPPEQAQFLNTRQFNITEIARWYNVPPHMLRELSKSSFNNIESESLHYILNSVLPWLVRWEDECNRQLLSEEDQESHFFKFIVHGLLRGDMKTQAQFFKDMLGVGVYDINEVREYLDMNPVNGGELRLVPLNMTTPERAAKGEPEQPVQPVDEIKEEEIEEDEPEESDDDSNQAVISTLRYSLSCILTGLIGFEARQAVRMANNPREFEAKCHKFYDEKFQATFAREIGPLLFGCRNLGATIELKQFVSNHIEKSKGELLALLDCPLDQFSAAVQDAVDGWDARVFEEVDSIFGEPA